MIINKTNLVMRLPEIMSIIADGKDYDIDIKLHRKKRSIDANALCWKVCSLIAEKVNAGKDEIYIQMLKRYGQSEIFSIRSDIDVKGYFKYYEVFGKGVVNGKEFNHYKIIKGSSEYNTKEMSVLLDGIISEAKDLGIEVMSESELSLIKGAWG